MAKEKTIEFATPKWEYLDVKIVGDTPLIVHAWSQKAKIIMLEQQMQKASAKKKQREPKVPWNDFKNSLYWLTEMPDDGGDDTDAKKKFLAAYDAGARFGFKADGIKQCAASGAYRNGYSKNAISVKSLFYLYGSTDASTFELAEIVGSMPKIREDIVRVGMGKTVDLRYRAQFDEWSIPLTIKYNANGMYSIDQLLTFIEVGGMTVGIGEWRMEHNGQYGAFHVSA